MLFRECKMEDAGILKLPENSIDAVISSPPYMNALDYGRDNRLRLWFLGVTDYKYYDNFKILDILEDEIPYARRARKEGNSTKKEWTVIMRKEG
jgi:DNA modification methylase